MKKALLVLSIVGIVFLAGCATFEKIAPSSLDDQGNAIPGTHQLNSLAQAGVDMTGPYGKAAAAIPLLVWNFVELVRAKKREKGFIATVKALKEAGDDPNTKAAFEKIKGHLKVAHEHSGTTVVVKDLLAKI